MFRWLKHYTNQSINQFI